MGFHLNDIFLPFRPVIVNTEDGEGGGTGDVVGPDGGVATGEIPLFSGTTGKLIGGSGLTTADLSTQTLAASIATAAGTAAKTTTTAEPAWHRLVILTFTNGNTANSPTVSFDGGTPRPIRVAGSAATSRNFGLNDGTKVACWWDGVALTAFSHADGNVVGPASATNGAIPLYDGITGRLLQNSTLLAADLQRTVPRTLWVAPGGDNGTAQVGQRLKPYLTVQAAIDAASVLTAGNVHIYVLPGDYGPESLTIADAAPGTQDIRLMTFPGFRVANLNVEADAYLSVDYIEVSNETTVNGSLTTYGPVSLGGIPPSTGNFLLYGVTRATAIALDPGAMFVAHGRVTCNSFSGNDAEVYLYRGMEAVACDFTDGLVYFDHSNIGEVNLYSNTADITGMFSTVNLSATIMAFVTGTKNPAALLTDVNILNDGYGAYFGDVGSLYVGSGSTIEVESAQFITLDDADGGPAVCFVTQGRATQIVTMGTEAQLSINGGKVEGGITMSENGVLVLSNLALLSGVTSTDYTGTEVYSYNCQRTLWGSISASFPTRIISLTII